MDAISTIFTSVPLDFFILGGIVLVLAVDSMRSGIGRSCALAVALPLGLLLYSLMGKALLIGSLSFLTSSPMMQAATLSAIIVIAYFLVRRMGLEYVDGGMGEPVQAILAAAAVAVIFAVVWLQMPVFGAFWQFGDQISAIFAESYRLWWLVGAYAALAFARG